MNAGRDFSRRVWEVGRVWRSKTESLQFALLRAPFLPLPSFIFAFLLFVITPYPGRRACALVLDFG